MRVTMLLADFANITADGKINVLGIFDKIQANQFPVRLPSMVLVARISLDIGERPIKRDLAIRLVEQDGTQLLEITGEVVFPDMPHGELPQFNIITGIQGVIFPMPGPHAFHLYLNEHSVYELPIPVIQIEQPS
jgi:hypothetical protein